MRRIVLQILVSLLILAAGGLALYSVHVANFREYRRSEAGDVIQYPRDWLLPWQEAIAARLGHVLGTLFVLLFVYTVFMGANNIHDRYLRNRGVSRLLTYLTVLWVTLIGIYGFTTSMWGQDSMLRPFFGPKIFYGGPKHVINQCEHKIKIVREDPTLSSKAKQAEIARLQRAIADIRLEAEMEEMFVLSEQAIRKRILQERHNTNP